MKCCKIPNKISRIHLHISCVLIVILWKNDNFCDLCKKHKKYHVKSRILASKFVFFTQATKDVHFLWNNVLNSWHVKIYAQTFFCLFTVTLCIHDRNCRCEIVYNEIGTLIASMFSFINTEQAVHVSDILWCDCERHGRKVSTRANNQEQTWTKKKFLNKLGFI